MFSKSDSYSSIRSEKSPSSSPAQLIAIKKLHEDWNSGNESDEPTSDCFSCGSSPSTNPGSPGLSFRPRLRQLERSRTFNSDITDEAESPIFLESEEDKMMFEVHRMNEYQKNTTDLTKETGWSSDGGIGEVGENGTLSRSPKTEAKKSHRAFSAAGVIGRLSPLLGHRKTSRTLESRRKPKEPLAGRKSSSFGEYGQLEKQKEKVDADKAVIEVPKPKYYSPQQKRQTSHIGLKRVESTPLLWTSQPTIAIKSPPFPEFRNSELSPPTRPRSRSTRASSSEPIKAPLTRQRSASMDHMHDTRVSPYRPSRNSGNHFHFPGRPDTMQSSLQRPITRSLPTSPIPNGDSPPDSFGVTIFVSKNLAAGNPARPSDARESRSPAQKMKSAAFTTPVDEKEEHNHIISKHSENNANGQVQVRSRKHSKQSSMDKSEKRHSSERHRQEDAKAKKRQERYLTDKQSSDDSPSKSPSPNPFQRGEAFRRSSKGKGSRKVRSKSKSSDASQHPPVIDVTPADARVPQVDIHACERLQGESEEDAQTRLQALKTRSARNRRGSAVVQIPNASIRMDLHTLYVESLSTSQPKMRGRSFDEYTSGWGKKLRRMSSHSLDDDPETEKKSRWTHLLQKFQKRESMGSLDDFRDCLAHLRSNLVEDTEHELSVFVDSHWSKLPEVNGFNDHQSHSFNTQDLDSLPPGERKRFEALWELFYAEVVYLIDHLLVLRNVFAKPLEHTKSFGFLTMVEEQVLFTNLEKLVEVTAKFAKRLLLIFKEPSPSVTKSTEVIVKAFTEFDRTVSPEYHEYCLNYQRAKNHITGLKEDEEFREFVQWCESDQRCKRRRLNDLLVAPLQHLTKYPLLLKAIRNKTQKNDKNYYLLTATILTIEKSIKMIEKRVSLVANLERIQEIQDAIIWPPLSELDQKVYIPDFMKSELSMQPCETVLINPARVLHHEGYLTLIDHNKFEVYVFLFDDMLLITKCKRKMVKRRNTSPPDPVTIDSPKAVKKLPGENTGMQFLVHKQPVPLDRFTIHDCDDYQNGGGTVKNGFVIVQTNRFRQVVSCFTFQALSSDEKVTWLKKLRKHQHEFCTGSEQHSDEEYVI